MSNPLSNPLPSEKLSQFVSTMRSTDIASAGINEYHLQYIRRMLPVLDYYVDIYARCIEWITKQTQKPLEQLTLVDYGGGEGFCSMLMKYIGAHQVIYVDMNPEASDTIGRLSDLMGWGPDVVLTGDARSLREWCQRESEVPDGVLGMDVIEHIYSLDEFFGELTSISPKIQMVFTTASTPYNRRKVRELHKVMLTDELGDEHHEGFREMRRQFIQKHNPQMGNEQLDYWATNTRGLNYDDILRAVDRNSPNLLRDKYNTCDPSTGSWTERILPVEDYRQLLLPYQYQLDEALGFYNERHNGLKGTLARMANRRIARRGGRRIAPFLFLTATPSETNL